MLPACPDAAIPSHIAAAWSMYVLLGSGALAAFWRSAAQHFLRLLPPPPPVFFGAPASAESTGATGSGASSTGAVGVGVAAGAAEGRGGGGSSFLQASGAAMIPASATAIVIERTLMTLSSLLGAF